MHESVILPLAKQDIKEAATWYNERQPGLGKKFTVVVRKAVHYIPSKSIRSSVSRLVDAAIFSCFSKMDTSTRRPRAGLG
jgi:hypothetical protein